MSLRRRWLVWRNRQLSDPAIQRRLAASPLTRPVARRRAAGLFDLVAGFTYSQVLRAFVEGGLLDRLALATADLPAIAATADLSEDAALRLMHAATALDLVETVAPGEWTLGQQGAALAGNPGAVAMIRHHALLYQDLADPLALLRDDRSTATALSSFWAYSATNAEAATYSQLMAESHAMVAQQVLDAVHVASLSSLLDIGGGHGAFAAAVLERAPRLRVGVFDLPPVLDGMAPATRARVESHPGDFFRDPVPTGYRAASLVRILHDHDDASALALLGKIRASLPNGGTLLVAEPMAGTKGAARMGDAYFGLYLWAMRSGRPRRCAEIGAMIEAAGFASWREISTAQPIICRLIVARA